MSDPDETALATYRKYRDSQWRGRHPQRETAPSGAMQFPGAEDVFELTEAGSMATVTHRQSQAKWAVDLRSAGQ
jgi:hypothetical protein